MHKLLLILFFVFIGNFAYSQSYSKHIDSLIRVAENASIDSAATLYYNIGVELSYSNPVDAIKFLKNSIDYSIKCDNYRQLCQSVSYTGISFLSMGHFDKSFEYFNKQLSLAIKYNMDVEIIWANSNIGLSCLLINYPKLAQKYLFDALHKVNEINEKEMSHHVYSNLGWYYLQERQFDSALFWTNKALDIRLTRDSKFHIGSTYRDLGNIYFEMGNFEMARHFYDVSINYIDTMNTDMPASINVKMSRIYFVEGDLNQAFDAARKAISRAQKFNNLKIIGDAYSLMGNMYFSFENYIMAEKYYAGQILYNDSCRTIDLSKKIYDAQFIKEMYKQDNDIEIVNTHFRENLYVGIIILIIIIVVIVIAIRLKIRSKALENISQKLAYHDKQQSDSLMYAKKIQNAVLPDINSIMWPDCKKFLISMNKQVVSGNLFWHYQKDNYVMFAVANCGTYGAPGACLSMLCTSLLYELAHKLNSPKKVIEGVRDNLKDMIKNFNNNSNYIPNADCSLIAIDTNTKTLFYSSVKYPLFYIRNQKLETLGELKENENIFTTKLENYSLQLEKNDILYLTTPGLINQNGGQNNIRLGVDDFCKLILKNSLEEFDSIKENLEKDIKAFIGTNNLKSDITLAAFSIE